MPNMRRMAATNGIYLVFYRVMDFVQIIHIHCNDHTPATEKDMGTINYKI